MKTKTIIAAALISSAAIVGVGAVASSDTGADRRAAEEAKAASKALDKRRPEQAVAAAEQAVAFAPREAGYRALLGQAYLQAGRFKSAADALKDALALEPGNGGVALQLALAQIGSGDWGAARTTLADNEASIPATDRGLAMALAGDPGSAIALLTAAAREPDASPKTRQNLALALGLAGRWQEAKVVASYDVAPDQLDARIMQWIAFAKPQGAADQIAAMLGVTPIEDAGQPVRLALVADVPAVQTAEAPPPPAAEAPQQVAVAEPVAAPAPVVEARPEPVAATAEAFVRTPATRPAVVFAERREIVQALPASYRPYSVQTFRMARAAVGRRAPVASGGYVVQLGAFENAAVAKDAWSRLSRRHAALKSRVPSGADFSFAGGDYYRLSVGGFDRTQAVAMCRQLRAAGGRCFVRTGAGDTIAQWVRRDSQLASRVAAFRRG